MDLHHSPVARAWRKWRSPSDLSVPRRSLNAEDTSRRFLVRRDAALVRPVGGGLGEAPAYPHRGDHRGVLPLTALAFLGCLHADQVRGTLRGGRSADDWKLLPKESPLPARYLAGIGLGIAVCVALPYAEEMTRCVKAARRRGTR
ncbi:hypothetical protein WKI65_28025 [Streptomyces sp. MS1.AVA.3]|uniref:hypothetical protein n=1 Tax=Streptomyces decoyicus TaxID=249567 RepID=UPI0030C0E9B7